MIQTKRKGQVCFVVTCSPRLSHVYLVYLNENSPAVTAIFDNILYAVNSKLLCKVENCVSVSVLLLILPHESFGKSNIYSSKH